MARSARRRRGGDVWVTMRAALSAIGSKSVAPAWKEASPSSRRSLLRWTSSSRLKSCGRHFRKSRKAKLEAECSLAWQGAARSTLSRRLRRRSRLSRKRRCGLDRLVAAPSRINPLRGCNNASRRAMASRTSRMVTRQPIGALGSAGESRADSGHESSVLHLTKLTVRGLLGRFNHEIEFSESWEFAILHGLSAGIAAVRPRRPRLLRGSKGRCSTQKRSHEGGRPCSPDARRKSTTRVPRALAPRPT